MLAERLRRHVRLLQKFRTLDPALLGQNTNAVAEILDPGIGFANRPLGPEQRRARHPLPRHLQKSRQLAHALMALRPGRPAARHPAERGK